MLNRYIISFKIQAGVLSVLSLLLLATPSLSKADTSYRVEGRGFGHGVGMSQWGAYGFAKRGSTHDRILAHYYLGTEIEQAPTNRKTVRVLVKSGRSITFSGADRANGKSLSPERRYKVKRNGENLVLRTDSNRYIETFKDNVKLTGTLQKVLAGRSLGGADNARYRGYLKLVPDGRRDLQVVNVVGLERYLQGVVSAEVPASWPANALQAQAVAARSYALATGKEKGNFDQYADTRSQMYLGAKGETGATNRAVSATKGEIVTYQGKVATTYFFSASGGKTESIENAWPGSKPVPYLTGVDDPYEGDSSEHRWGPLEFSSGSLTGKFKSRLKGSFEGLEVVERGPSGRAVKVKLLGSKGTTTVSGPYVREALGLRSTWFYLKKS